ncbi:CsbD family protein [Haliangium ochraceum]|uniref:CsbD family protein n=1 Tax=Haliangium ochraceum (strain DSM 14365 / JCM 11303 / SMP-2) TaxID=502025 RepID=D0LRW5_HALO1|nr:CsbD family protein [Haliangium ochraceum]ACY19107.1 CsbD family protein [Haliangium ochraceum DSM 14365]
MNSDIIEGKLKQMGGKIRDKWGKLTDDDVDHIGGKRDRLVGRLQERYGYAKDRAEREIDEWIDKV